MKIIPKLQSLAESLEVLAIVLPEKVVNTILTHFHFSPKRNGLLVVSACDGEINVEVDCEAGLDTQTPADFLMPILLLSLLRDRNEDAFTIDIDKTLAKVVLSEDEFKIPLHSQADAFPAMPEDEMTVGMKVRAAELSLALSRALTAAARSIQRYNVNCVHIEVVQKKIAIVGADSNQLMVSKLRDSSGANCEFTSNIPTKSAEVLCKLCEKIDADEEVEIYTNGHKTFARSKAFRFSTLHTEGAFPKYENFMPKESTKEAIVSKSALTLAVSRARIFATDDSAGIDFDFEEDRLTLRSSEKDKGQSKQRLPIDYAGEPCVVCMKSKFIVNACEIVKGENVTLEFCDSVKAIMCKDGFSTYVFMPINKLDGGV